MGKYTIGVQGQHRAGGVEREAVFFTWRGHVEGDEGFEVRLHLRVHVGPKACAQVRAQLVAHVLRPAAAHNAAHATVVACTYARHTLFTPVSIVFVTVCNYMT